MTREIALAALPVWLMVGASLVSLGVSIWSLGWPSVKGTVEVSILDQASSWTTHVAGKSSIQYKAETEDHHLAYSYCVDGIQYLGSNVNPWGTSGWKLTSGGDIDLPDSGKILWSGARDLAKWYRPGVVVNVYYCPIYPRWSCLEPGGFFLPLLFAGLGVFLHFCLR